MIKTGDILTVMNNQFFEKYIGEKVAKTNLKKGKEVFNKKKFKSGNYINTIKGVMTHPELNIPAYTFEEDDSYVECRRCKIIIKHDDFNDLIKTKKQIIDDINNYFEGDNAEHFTEKYYENLKLKLNNVELKINEL